MADRKHRLNLILLGLALLGLAGGLGAQWLGWADGAVWLILAGAVPVLATVLVDSMASLWRRQVGLDIIALHSMGGALALDGSRTHFCHALADAYHEEAVAAGHEVRRIAVAELGLPPLRSKQDWEAGTPPDAARRCQDDIRWPEHLLIVYPLWLGTMPAVLKGFFEQVFRPGFAISPGRSGAVMTKLLKGRSARIVVTMGMPALVYRWYFGAHGLKNLKRNILGFTGIGPIRDSLLGMVEPGNSRRHRKWLISMTALGQRGR